ncbi:MAG: hypothetical protein ACLVEJ_05715 [Parabacteroides sp.]
MRDLGNSFFQTDISNEAAVFSRFHVVELTLSLHKGFRKSFYDMVEKEGGICFGDISD